MTRTEVFLVDDHDIVRQGLRLLVDAEADMRVVGEAAHARGLCDLVEASGAGVVVLDVSMPDVSGAEATAELKKCLPGVKVVALTRHTEKAYVQEMMRAGASGYILKQNGAATLLEAVRAVVRGGTFLDPAIARLLIEDLTSVASRSSRSASTLTPRERQVATMVAYGHTNKEIAAELGIGVKTVETHKTNVMQKLALTSRAELVQFALEQGWIDRVHRS
jgi:two-component system, NarL family, response regulator NreC